MFKAWLDASVARARSNRAEAPGELSKADAAWVVAGLASVSRRPLPKLAWSETASLAELGRVVLDVGFKLVEASLAELADEAAAQSSARWFVWTSVDGALRPAAVLSREGDKLLLAVPGQQTPVAASLAAVRAAASQGFRFVPHFPADEDELEKFGWRWFARAFFARKPVIRDIVIASLVVSLIGLVFPLATQAIVDKVITNQATSTLIALGTGIGLMAVFSALMGWLRQKLLLRLSNVVDAELSQRVMLHLLQLPLPYFTSRSTGTIINKVHGIERIRSFMAGAFLLVALDLPFMLVFLGLMVSYSVSLSAVVLGFLVVMLTTSFLAGPVLRARANESMQLGAKLQGYVTEQVGAVETLKCLQLEPVVARQFQGLNEAQLQAQLRLQEFSNGYGSFMQLAEQLMNALVLCLGAYWAMTSSDLTIGMLVAFQMFAQRVAQPLLKLSGMWQELQQVRVSAKMLGEIVNQPIERYSAHASSAGQVQGALAVDRLSFGYAEDRPPLYENLSFNVEPGKVVLVTGPSGSGKSTLAKLLLGLYTGYKGTMRLDGRDLRSMSVNELRAVFGVVPQESVLFTGTILENLMAVAPDATFERAVLACKMAGIHQVIENLPEGYQTKVGERGAGLSGGQRQRLAIARALLKRPRVLIFDEAVASLDDAAAEQVAKAVNEVRGKVTVLFITHKVPKGLAMDAHLQLGAK
jgi:subfamily B ATP-binding cassette protein HlyB/CyaB